MIPEGLMCILRESCMGERERKILYVHTDSEVEYECGGDRKGQH